MWMVLWVLVEIRACFKPTSCLTVGKCAKPKASNQKDIKQGGGDLHLLRNFPRSLSLHITTSNRPQREHEMICTRSARSPILNAIHIHRNDKIPILVGFYAWESCITPEINDPINIGAVEKKTSPKHFYSDLTIAFDA